MRVIGDISDVRVEELSRTVSGFATLEDAVRWTLTQNLELADVVMMDEFTQDVVVPLPDGLVLVFDST